MCQNSLSETECSQIKDVLNSALDKLIVGCESLNMKLAFEIFSDSSDFLMMGTDGTLCDFQTYFRNNIAYLENCDSFEINTYKREIRILSEKTALLSWAYGVEAKINTGELDIIDNAGATFIFQKIEKTWKVIYYHESSVPLKRIRKN